MEQRPLVLSLSNDEKTAQRPGRDTRELRGHTGKGTSTLRQRESYELRTGLWRADRNDDVLLTLVHIADRVPGCPGRQLGFPQNLAEDVLTNAARLCLWVEWGIEGKQELKQALFLEGLSFDGEEFGTTVTSLVFKDFEALRPTGTDLASPRGIALMWKPKLQEKALSAAC